MVVRQPRFVFVLLLLIFVVGAVAPAYGKQRAGVLGVTAPRYSQYASYIRNLITDDVLASGRFHVIERGAIDQVLREQRFQGSGAIDEATAVTVGKILGIDIGIMGSLESLEARRHDLYYTADATVLIRIVGIQSGQLLATVRVTGSATGDTADEARRKALDKGFGPRFQNELAAVFPFAATITEVRGDGIRGDTVFISLGRNDGVQTGTRFEVQRPDVTALAGKELDEEDYFMRPIGVIEVTDTSAEFARATIVETSEPFRNGDGVVELVPPTPARDGDTWLYVLGVLLLLLFIGQDGDFSL